MIKELKIVFEEIYSMDFGYPAEGYFDIGAPQNIIDELKTYNLPGFYISFQIDCGHINAMDIHNGYWLDKGESVVRKFQDNPNINTIAIGSDGGGKSFQNKII